MDRNDILDRHEAAESERRQLDAKCKRRALRRQAEEFAARCRDYAQRNDQESASMLSTHRPRGILRPAGRGPSLIRRLSAWRCRQYAEKLRTIAGRVDQRGYVTNGDDVEASGWFG